MAKRVIVIGAGTSGICAAKNALQKGFEVVVYEQTKYLGGLWNYTDKTGVDVNGIHQYYMYKDLKTNVPKEIMRFTDYGYDVENKSFLDPEEVLNFVQSYARDFDIPKCVLFEHQVILVSPINYKQWEVLVKDLQTGNYITEVFDYALICTGMNSNPLMPKFKGQELFTGLQKHCFDFRKKEEFLDKKVLVIGSGPSALDIAMLIAGCAQEVTLSHHIPLKAAMLELKDNLIQRPDVKELTANGAVFEDNSICTVDSILYCTGFKYSFPFLRHDCGIRVEDNHVQPLFKQVLNINFPSMAFIGLNSFVCFQMHVDLQSQFVLEMWRTNTSFPSTEDMIKDARDELENRFALGWKKSHAHKIGIPFMADYYQSLSEMSGIPAMANVYINMFKAVDCGILGNLLDYRKDLYIVLDDENFTKTTATDSDTQ